MPVERRLDVRSQVEREPQVMVAAIDLVDDVDTTRSAVEPDAASVPDRPRERAVAVVLRSPLCRVTDILNADHCRVRVPEPEKGAAVSRLVLAVDLDRVV